MAITLTTLGASLGLLEIGAYIRAAFQPLKIELKRFEPIQPPVYAPVPTGDFMPATEAMTEERVPVAEADTEDTGVNGDYFIIDDRPKGFKDFEQLTIQDRDWDEKAGKVMPIKPRGIVIAEDDLIDLSRVKITGKRVSLATEKHRAISYRFEGEFIDEIDELKDENGDFYKTHVYLKGRLTKLKDGKKIAEANVRFTIGHGC